jgi:UDP-galactopyranose mutase
MEVDYLIVGSGLTGATIARHLADRGEKILVLERRNHVGGNVHDHVHPSGIRIHTYGPHYFRTSSERIWRYVNRFAAFDRFEAVLMSFVDNAYEHWPIQSEYISRTIGEAWQPAFTGTPRNLEEASLAMMPQAIYEKFIKGYNEKQWGRACTELSASLAGRFDVRQNGDLRLKDSPYQGIPSAGYAAFMANMLRGIPVLLNVDHLRHASTFRAAKKVIYTGPIDEYFGYDLGKLEYRGQRRSHDYLPHIDQLQPTAQVNYPLHADGPHIRILEWKHMMPAALAQRIKGTVVTREVPFTPDDPVDYEYPFPSAENQALYKRYAERAERLDDVIFCGRLGEYRYLDMDQAIGRAMKIVERLTSAKPDDAQAAAAA